MAAPPTPKATFAPVLNGLENNRCGVGVYPGIEEFTTTGVPAGCEDGVLLPGLNELIVFCTVFTVLAAAFTPALILSKILAALVEVLVLVVGKTIGVDGSKMDPSPLPPYLNALVFMVKKLSCCCFLSCGSVQYTADQ